MYCTCIVHVCTCICIHVRLKDGEVVATDFSSSDSTHVITNVSQSDTGYYSCRASNDYSAIISTVATVLVQGAQPLKALLNHAARVLSTSASFTYTCSLQRQLMAFAPPTHVLTSSHYLITAPTTIQRRSTKACATQTRVTAARKARAAREPPPTAAVPRHWLKSTSIATPTRFRCTS